MTTHLSLDFQKEIARCHRYMGFQLFHTLVFLGAGVALLWSSIYGYTGGYYRHAITIGGAGVIISVGLFFGVVTIRTLIEKRRLVNTEQKMKNFKN